MDELDIQQIVKVFLRVDVATHKRKCAVRAGVRESSELEATCEHDFDIVRHWCRHCGLTHEEIYFGKRNG